MMTDKKARVEYKDQEPCANVHSQAGFYSSMVMIAPDSSTETAGGVERAPGPFNLASHLGR